MSATMKPLPQFPEYPDDEMLRRSAEFRDMMCRRRSVRHFSQRPVSRRVIEDALRAAASGPSGANCQPWHFVVVEDPQIKARIRAAAEEVERSFYAGRAGEQWLSSLAPLGTGPVKPFLTDAPYLIAVFEQRWGVDADGRRITHYYPRESVGMAIGILIAALHNAGLGVLTYTPAPMDFLCGILRRPANERPFVLLVVGHPAQDAAVPDIRRKAFEQVVTWV